MKNKVLTMVLILLYIELGVFKLNYKEKILYVLL